MVSLGRSSLGELMPVLESGDRLSRIEFERRYQGMPEVKKAELVEGVVYVASPLRYRQHGQPHSDIMTWLGVYRAATPGVYCANNATVRLDGKNEPQPDALLRLDESLGGQSRISEDDYLEGAPELIVEIAASTASYDLHDNGGLSSSWGSGLFGLGGAGTGVSLVCAEGWGLSAARARRCRLSE